MKQVPAIEVFLPMPPTTNLLFVAFVNRKTQKIQRVKSPQYVAWIEEAGRKPLAGEWRRITEDKGNGIPWELHLIVYGLPPAADLSNRIKAAEDLLCAMTGLEDRNTRRITVDRADADPLLGACIQVCAMTVGKGVKA